MKTIAVSASHAHKRMCQHSRHVMDKFQAQAPTQTEIDSQPARQRQTDRRTGGSRDIPSLRKTIPPWHTCCVQLRAFVSFNVVYVPHAHAHTQAHTTKEHTDTRRHTQTDDTHTHTHTHAHTHVHEHHTRRHASTHMHVRTSCRAALKSPNFCGSTAFKIEATLPPRNRSFIYGEQAADYTVNL